MSVPAIELINVTAGYAGHPIQNNVSFRIEQGEIVALLGGSGCGKSTMLKTIIGLLPVINGDIRIAGESLVNCDQFKKREILRKGIEKEHAQDRIAAYAYKDKRRKVVRHMGRGQV